MKKKLLVMLVAVMCIMLCACGSSEGNSTENNQNNSEVATDKVEFSIVGEWKFLKTGSLVTFKEDGTYESYAGNGFKYEYKSDSNIVAIDIQGFGFFDEPVDFDIIYEDDTYRLQNLDIILVPASEYERLSANFEKYYSEYLNSLNTEQPIETETEKNEIYVVGEWVCKVGDYYQTYTFNEDGTMLGYCSEPSTYEIGTDILTIFTGETKYWYTIVEENGSIKLGNLIPANTSDKTENSLTFPTVEHITSDSVIEPVEFLYLIQIGLLEKNTVSCDVVNGEGNEFTQNFNINETDFLLRDTFGATGNVINTLIFSQRYIYGWENMNVTTATCPSTGKECYKLTATASADSKPEPFTVNVYLEKSTNQLTYIEGLNTISNFIYSK